MLKFLVVTRTVYPKILMLKINFWWAWSIGTTTVITYTLAAYPTMVVLYQCIYGCLWCTLFCKETIMDCIITEIEIQQWIKYPLSDQIIPSKGAQVNPKGWTLIKSLVSNIKSWFFTCGHCSKYMFTKHKIVRVKQFYYASYYINLHIENVYSNQSVL